MKIPKFENIYNKNNKHDDKKHSYRFKILHNGLKPEDREKIMRIVNANRKEADK